MVTVVAMLTFVIMVKIVLGLLYFSYHGCHCYMITRVTFLPVLTFPTMVALVTLCRYDYVKAREVFRSVDRF